MSTISRWPFIYMWRHLLATTLCSRQCTAMQSNASFLPIICNIHVTLPLVNLMFLSVFWQSGISYC